jgi:hypothetical protein
VSTPDPFDQRYSELLNSGSTDPFEQRLSELSRGIPLDDESSGAWSRFMEGVGNAAETLGWVVNPIGSMQERGQGHIALFGAGLASGALLDPLAALSQGSALLTAKAEEIIGIPGAFSAVTELQTKARNFFLRSKEGLYSMAEQQALEAGMTPEEIADAYGTGNFVGFIAPVSASIKGASLLLRAPVTLSRHVFAGTLITDTVAGAIYGAAFREGDTLEERGKNLLHESALFGVGRLVLNGLPLAYKAYRMKRSRDIAAGLDVDRTLRSMENSSSVVIESEETASAIARLLSEENYLASSPAAQEIIARNANEVALMTAVMDVAKSRATGGSIRVRDASFGELVDLTEASQPRIRQAISDHFGVPFDERIKFDVLKGPDEEFRIFFGPKGLSNNQRRQFKREGRFEGMRVFRGSDEYRYVSKASREGYVKLRRADDTFVEVKATNITDLPTYTEELIPTPEVDALFQNFRETFQDNLRRLAQSGGAITEEDLIRAVREGTLKIDDQGRRAFDVGGAIIYPEELGLAAGEDAVSAVVLNRAPGWRPDPTDMTGGAPRAMIVRNASAGANPMEKPWRVSYFDDSFSSVGHQSFDTLEQAAQFAQADNWIPVETVTNFATSNQVRALISRRGGDLANILEPPPVVTFEQAFDSWVREVGIVTKEAGARDVRGRFVSREILPTDIEAVRANFADRLRREMWEAVPAEDRKVFDAIRNQLDEALDKGELPFEVLAHQKGFHVERRPDGVIELREINTGAKFALGSERVAQQWIREVIRDESSMATILEMGSNGMASISGGFRHPETAWNITAENVARQTPEIIPQATFRNVRDWTIALEEKIGIPLFSRGFNALDEGATRAKNRYEPWAKQIQSAWRGISDREKNQIVEFWQKVEGQPITNDAALQIGREMGLSSKQLAAWSRARAIWDEGFKMAGLPPSRFINNYYGRVRPYVEKNGVVDFDDIFGAEGVPGEFQFFAEMSRTGELALIETNPEIVMHKWFRSLFFSQEVKPHWDHLAQLVDRGHGKFKKPALKIRDLPQETIAQITRMRPGIDISEPVLAKPIRDVISEYLTIIRGNPGEGLERLRWFSRKMFSSLGVEADERVMEEFFNTAMSSMYGAAMGLRASLVARNFTQTTWNLYPRLGSRHMNESLGKAMTQEGFDEAIDAGAIRLAEAGIPYGDAIFEHMQKNMVLEGSGPLSNAVAASVRLGLRAGYITRKTAEKFLIPYSSGDQMSRAWAYHWQKSHAARLLDQFENRRIGWEKFTEDALPFFSETVKGNFADMYRRLGKESALRYIGKMAADETHFIYGVGAQPAWMQRPLGRMFGMFGTWPLWAGELYLNRAWKGTWKQRAAFHARTLAITGAFGNMMVESGVDLWNWISPGSVFGWSGGPAVDHAINLKRAIEAPMDQKAAALRRLALGVGRLSLPGQLAYTDFAETMNQDNPRDAFMRLMMGRPVDSTHFGMEYLYSGDDVPNTIDYQNPSTREAIILPEGSKPRLHMPTVEEMQNLLAPAEDRVSTEFSVRTTPNIGNLQGNM